MLLGPCNQGIFFIGPSLCFTHLMSGLTINSPDSLPYGLLPAENVKKKTFPGCEPVDNTLEWIRLYLAHDVLQI